MTEKRARQRLAALFRKARLVAGVNQSVFGERLSITQAHVSKIENGVSAPGRGTLALLSKHYDVDYELAYSLLLAVRRGAEKARWTRQSARAEACR